MTLTYKIIFCFVTLVVVFFAGRLSASRAEAPAAVVVHHKEEKSEKIIDTKQEKKIFKSNKHKSKIKFSEKKPDGSEKTLEIVSNDTNEITTGQILNLSALDTEARTIEKIELKTAEKRLDLVFFGNLEIPTTYSLKPIDLESVKKHDAYFGSKLSFVPTESWTINSGWKQYTTENKTSAFIEMEYRTKLW